LPENRVSPAFVHIGTHKTGTTSFQQWASKNRIELANATGLEYYEGLFAPSHYEIPMLCMRSNRNMPMRAKWPDWCLDEWQQSAKMHVRNEVERHEGPLLVSSEALSYIRHPDEVERLIDLLRPREITVIVVLREPASFLLSYRKTLTRSGFNFSSYRESFAYVEDDSWLVDYDSLLAVYRKVLGSDRVMSVQYEPALERYGSIIPALLGAIGFSPSEIPPWRDFPHYEITPRTPKRGSARKRLRRLFKRLG